MQSLSRLKLRSGDRGENGKAHDFLWYSRGLRAKALGEVFSSGEGEGLLCVRQKNEIEFFHNPHHGWWRQRMRRSEHVLMQVCARASGTLL